MLFLKVGAWLWRLLVFLLYLFLLSPIIIIVITSFNDASYLSFPPEQWSLRWYSALLDNEAFVRGFRVSFILAIGTTLLAIIIGLPAAIAISKFQFPGRGFFVGFFTMPLMVPGIVLGLGLLLVFSRYNLVATYPGLLAAHLVVTVPYVIRTVATSLLTMPKAYEEAALSLGATPFTAFRRITLPLISPGLIAGAAIAFIISFDEVVLTLFLVGPRLTTLPVEIFRYVQFSTDPQVAALSVVLIAISLLIVVVIERALGLRKTLQSG